MMTYYNKFKIINELTSQGFFWMARVSVFFAFENLALTELGSTLNELILWLNL